jgi:hypothetical protein
LNVYNASDVRQIEIRTAEPLVPGPNYLEVEIAVAKLKKYISPGSDEISAEVIQGRGEVLLSAIHKLINIVRNKEEGDKTDGNIYCGMSLLSTSYKTISNILLSK